MLQEKATISFGMFGMEDKKCILRGFCRCFCVAQWF